MISIQVAELARVVTGEMFADDAGARKAVTGLSWDSRKLEDGCIFLAMPGQRVDGNDFIVTAIQTSAGAVITTREPSSSLKAIAGEFACPLIYVPDGIEALMRLASWWRRKLHAVCVGVTGSVGKTTTKDFVAAVLSQRLKTSATIGNHNNEIGVPATILGADVDVEALVVEMGMRGSGQIAKLCELAMPSIGIVTNVGTAHLELLGSQDAIASAKSELYAALPPTGMAVVNADDPYCSYLIEHGKLEEHSVRTITFGMEAKADVSALNLAFDRHGCALFQLCVGDQQSVDVHLPIAGKHNVSNALAAASVGYYLGFKPAELARGLEAVQSSSMRMEILSTPSGATLINDAYNANPQSMTASLDALASMECTGRRIAVLGDMGELGDMARDLHEKVGEHAASVGVDILVCIGDFSEAVAEGASKGGMDEAFIHRFASVDDAVGYVVRTVQKGDLVLIKASRFMGLERIAKAVMS